MARHKTIDSSDKIRSELYEKYIRPNHALVRGTVALLTQKKSEIDDNFQDICYILLRNIDTYNEEYKLSTWILTVCRREIGKLEARKDSYVDARKGSEFEYVTKHHGYKSRYRPKKAKDFVNVYDDSVFRSEPNPMIHDGVDEKTLKLLKTISPETNFGLGSYKDIEKGIIDSGDLDFLIHFRKYYYNEKVKDVAHVLNVDERDVKNALSRVKSRIKSILENL